MSRSVKPLPFKIKISSRQKRAKASKANLLMNPNRLHFYKLELINTPMSTRDLGINNLRWRLAFGIRDCVLHAVAKPEELARNRDMPLAELGPIADMTSDQRAALAQVVASAIDHGIHHFLYGLDNQPDGMELRYQGETLNVEGMYSLTCSDLPHISEESQYTLEGAPRRG